jgi:hypothetical protein
MVPSVTHIVQKVLGAKLCSKKQIEDYLHIGKETLRRRLEKHDWSFEEVIILAQVFGTSLSDMAGQQAPTFTTKTFQTLATATATLDKYLTDLLTDLQQLETVGVQHLYYAAKDLPLFCFFASPVLTPFKLYFWYITLFDNSPKRIKYGSNWLNTSIINKATLIYEKYKAIPSTEIWNYETINSTLHQIEYCINANLMRNADGLKILDALTAFINQLEQNCIDKNKNGRGSLTMYLNEVLLLDNNVIFDIGVKKIFYLPYQTLNFLSTDNELFIADNLAWFNKQWHKSTNLCMESEKERDRLFNHYKNEIEQCKLNCASTK